MRGLEPRRGSSGGNSTEGPASRTLPPSCSGSVEGSQKPRRPPSFLLLFKKNKRTSSSVTPQDTTFEALHLFAQAYWLCTKGEQRRGGWMSMSPRNHHPTIQISPLPVSVCPFPKILSISISISIIKGKRKRRERSHPPLSTDSSCMWGEDNDKK